MKLLTLLSNLFLFAPCYGIEKLKKHIEYKEYGGLERIIKDRYLRVLTTKNSIDYYIYQGQARGLQYEMVKRFVKKLNQKYAKGKKELKITFEMIPVDYDELIPMLKDGKGDIIATGLTKTKARAKDILFAKPYRKVDELIVTRKELARKNWLKGTFHVRKSSSYYEQVIKNKINYELVEDEVHTLNIIEMVSLGKFDYTIADTYIAKNAEHLFDNITVIETTPFGRNLEIGWATRLEDKELNAEISKFVPKIRKGSSIGNILDKKYLKDFGKITSEEFDLKTSTLSKYDKYFKKYAKQYDLDWRVVAALAFQESRFTQNIKNRWGAIGLMQVKQMTANEPYIKIRNISGHKNFENNIHAGVKYLSWIKKRYFDTKPKMREKDRIRFMMAAYNAGPARVLKAIKLARKKGLDPNKWFRNVELAMLQMKRTEPVLYVSDINKRYVSYLLLGIK